MLECSCRYNSGDVDAVMALMAPDVAYHDLALYQEPFRGKDAVRAYFEKVTATVPGDLQFTPDHITSGDPNAVGVQWCGTLMLKLHYLKGVHNAAVRNDAWLQAGGMQ